MPVLNEENTIYNPDEYQSETRNDTYENVGTFIKTRSGRVSRKPKYLNEY